MKLNSLQLRHFISHTETDLAFNGARLATFVGANGSGKSALAIDALRYALFDDARGRTDDLVQLGANEMSVRAEITFAGAEYSITRGRSTKARGSSFLELAIWDDALEAAAPSTGGWRPLSGDTIRDTQAKIAELLRMDADTFDTAVLLGQGQANRFAEATAGDRKRILGTVLGLDLWERAEARAREEARDVEGKTAADRATIGRLEAELTARPGIEEQQADARRRDTEYAVDDASDQKSRTALQAREVDLAAKAAAAAAAESEVTAAQTKLDEVAERYRRVSARKLEASNRLEGAERIIADADPDVATPDIPALEAEVARQEQAEAQDRELERAIATNQASVDQQSNAFDSAVENWRGQRNIYQGRIDDLAASLAGLPPIVCPKCSHSWQIAQADLAGKLRKAREDLEAIGAEPQEPIHLAMEAGKVERLRVNRRELALDPIRITTLRIDLRLALEARDQAAAIEAHRQIAEASRQAIAEAEAELAEITTAGTTARAALAAAKERAAAGSGLATELAEVRSSIETVEGRLTTIAQARRSVAGELERAAGLLERLDRLATERDELAAGLAESDQRLARLRRLVQAFGVTGIPARIIESVLPELTASANELLEQLRPGMTLDIRAQRAKKDGKGIVEALDLIVQDDAGERALGLYSGGERMSVSLALAVGLSRLVARRAGTAIRTLVIDEPDGLDADARRSFGQALRILAHQGELERVVLVSHHQDLADVGDSVFEVVKGPAGSVVTQIA